MSFEKRVEIGFGHCDPAGIVFYPRYFEMINATVEGFCREVLGWSFANIAAAQGNGVPTVSIACEFHAPSRVDDLLGFGLQVLRVGGASATFRVTARALTAPLGEKRLTAELTLCWLENGRAAPWPQPLRDRLVAAERESNEEITR